MKTSKATKKLLFFSVLVTAAYASIYSYFYFAYGENVFKDSGWVITLPYLAIVLLYLRQKNRLGSILLPAALVAVVYVLGKSAFIGLERAQWERGSTYPLWLAAEPQEGAETIGDLSPSCKRFISIAEKENVIFVRCGFFLHQSRVWKVTPDMIDETPTGPQ